MIDLGIGLAISQIQVHSACTGCQILVVQSVSLQPALWVEWHGPELGLKLSAGRAERSPLSTGSHAPVTIDGITKDIHGDLSTRWVALQGVYHWHGLYASAGVADVWGRFVEEGTYSPGGHVYHLTQTHEIAPIVGFGYQLEVKNHWEVQIGMEFMPNVIRSHWSDHSNILTFGVGLMYRF